MRQLLFKKKQPKAEPSVFCNFLPKALFSVSKRSSLPVEGVEDWGLEAIVGAGANRSSGVTVLVIIFLTPSLKAFYVMKL